MLLLLLAWLLAVGADMPQPASVVQDNHRYYTLTVFQHNEQNSFDENFIDMEKAEIKQGEIPQLYTCSRALYSRQQEHCTIGSRSTVQSAAGALCNRQQEHCTVGSRSTVQ
jgi:hypothetical protein